MPYSLRAVAPPASAAAALLLGAGCGDDDSGAGEVAITCRRLRLRGRTRDNCRRHAAHADQRERRQLHELVALRIDDDSDISIDDLAALPEEEIDEHLVPGPPALVLIAAPGEGPDQRGAGTLSEPGRYALVCFVPTGADPDGFLAAASEADDGPPEVGGRAAHIVNGMYAELTLE